MAVDAGKDLNRHQAGISGDPAGRNARHRVTTSRDAGDEPPATADEPAVQAAWLARIRTLRANGDDAAARDSLAEYRRRYPDAPLPADLDAWWRDDAAQKH